jgi:uncharacterized protein (DUF4415 family)
MAPKIRRDFPEPRLDDPDNPEWTAEDFAVAQGPEALSAAELAAFPRTTAGRPKLERPKIAVSLRLDAEVLQAFKAGGPGWQTKMNDVLKASLDGKPTKRRARS